MYVLFEKDEHEVFPSNRIYKTNEIKSFHHLLFITGIYHICLH